MKDYYAHLTNEEWAGLTPEEIAHCAELGRLAYAQRLIEAFCIIDPDTGEEVPQFEPDPTKPGSYRRTERSLATERKGGRSGWRGGAEPLA
jgi:hypothetical protein